MTPLSREAGTGCNFAGTSKTPVEGLKSTSEEVLWADFRGGVEEMEEAGEKLGTLEGGSERDEAGEILNVCVVLSGVIRDSRFIRASRRVLSFSAR